MKKLVFAASVLLFMASCANAAKLTIIKDGKSDYSIVLAKTASPSEHRAAVELKEYLYEMSGVRLSIVPERKGPSIFVGSDFLPADVDAKTFGDEDVIIRTVGNDLVISGAQARGSMYGVYELLEDTLGVRWYSQKVTKVPKMKAIVIPEMNIKDKPAFEFREMGYAEAFDRDWAARNRVNSNGARLDRTTGGKFSYGRFVHTFWELVPVGEYMGAHPEYFALVGGQRNGSQLCLTNPDVVKAVVSRLERWIADNPDARIWSVSQNDCYGFCECDNCKKVYEEEGSPSGAMLRFVNAVAAEIEKTHPKILIDTLAYQWTEAPCKITKPRENVRLRLCPISACQMHPYEKCPNDKAVVDNLHAWGSKTDNLYIWHYNTDFAAYLLPFPNFEELAADTKMYKQNGVKGMFWEGAYNTNGSEFSEMRSWVLAKLGWNENQDLDKLIKDFTNGYYEDGGPYIKEYFDLLHKEVREKNLHAICYLDARFPLFSPEVVAKSVKLFDQAEKAVADKPDVLQRVRQARLGIDFVQLTQPIMLGQTKGREKELLARLDQLCGRCRAYGIGMISEGEPVDAFYNRLKAQLGG